MHQGAAPDEVVVLFNRAKGARWTKAVLDDGGSQELVAADFDGDGWSALAGANHAGVCARDPVAKWRPEWPALRSPCAPRTSGGGVQLRRAQPPGRAERVTPC